jgi:hypothetical protein
MQRRLSSLSHKSSFGIAAYAGLECMQERSRQHTLPRQCPDLHVFASKPSFSNPVFLKRATVVV